MMLMRFNPRPAVRPGETIKAHRMAVRAYLFQSAPGREAGRDSGGRRADLRPTCFNPRPAVRPGETGSSPSSGPSPFSFNPRPAVRPGETMTWRMMVRSKCVSIRARP